jgi:predicted nucleotide-binding protein
MEKTKSYKHVKFSPETVRDALRVYMAGFPKNTHMPSWGRRVELDDESWGYDSDEEFLAGYLKSTCTKADYHYYIHPPKGGMIAFSFTFWKASITISVQQQTVPKIEVVFAIFERDAESARVPVPEMASTLIEPTIFIGHGHSMLWRELKDHLTDKHGYRVSAYEVGARAGHAVRDILEDLLTSSSFALLVMTGEDETGEGQLRARQNVIHELGLFQGKLGFSRAIAVVEKGTELMSNIEGIEQLRFSRGNIAEIYGDVVATLRREFSESW